MSKLPTIQAVWPNGAAFLKSYEAREEGPGRFFWTAPPGDLPAAMTPGQLVSVLLCFQAEQRDFHLHAHVLERHAASEPRGLKLELLLDEKEREELVLTCARQESVPFFRRRQQRIDCSLPVQVTVASGRRLTGIASDVSPSGLRLTLDPLLRVDELVRLAVTLPDSSPPLHVHGCVVSVSTSGPQKGVGIAFKFNSVEEREAVAHRIAALRPGG